jgi:hypothetical protein
MMNALKTEVVIGKDRKIVIDLPPDIPEGRAEVIVLVPEPTKTDVEALLRGIEAWRAQHPERFRSKAEIDRYLEEERASWGNEP